MVPSVFKLQCLYNVYVEIPNSAFILNCILEYHSSDVGLGNLLVSVRSIY